MTIWPRAWEYTTEDESQTQALGRWLGKSCQGGEILLLEGPLGAGKTCLTQGIAQGLGVDQPTASPTFVILRSYPGRCGLTLHHLDFYRLGGDEDLETVGVEDCLGPRSVIVAEWPDRCPGAFEDFTLWLRLTPLDSRRRRLQAYAGALAPNPLLHPPRSDSATGAR